MKLAETFNPYPKSKQIYGKSIKPTQRQMGAISQKVDRELKQRSDGYCELRKKCKGAYAVQRAHITGRKQLNHRTTVNDLIHCCLACHNWLDQDVEGIKYRKSLTG